MDSSLEKRFSDAYIANLDIIGEGFPAQLNAARRGWLESFNLLSIPSARDERYRHTDLRKVFGPERELYFTTAADAAVGERLPVDGYRVDVVNGFATADTGFMRLDNGVAYGSLKAAATLMEDVFTERYNSVADNDSEAVTALNSLFMQDGAFVYVPRGVEAERPFVLTFDYSSDEARLCFSRALIILEDGARADVVISHRDGGSGEIVADFVRETILGGGARLNMSEITRMNDRNALIIGAYLRQQADSRADMMNVWLRGGLTRVNARTDLAGRGADSNLYGLWFGTGDERTDVSMRVDHMVPDCTSFELVKGVVSAQAVGAFNGLVYVARDAQHTVALQQSRNLQMSETSRIFTEPQLEIYADDVKCSHGATVGQMDTEAIFYMRQRGISEEDARRLQMFGFVNDIISRCPHDGACDFVARLAEERIAEL